MSRVQMHSMLTSLLHAGAAERKHVTSAKIDPAKVSLSPGLHTVQATVRFKDPAWKQLVLTGCARGPDAYRPWLADIAVLSTLRIIRIT